MRDDRKPSQVRGRRMSGGPRARRRIVSRWRGAGLVRVDDHPGQTVSLSALQLESGAEREARLPDQPPCQLAVRRRPPTGPSLGSSLAARPERTLRTSMLPPALRERCRPIHILGGLRRCLLEPRPVARPPASTAACFGCLDGHEAARSQLVTHQHSDACLDGHEAPVADLVTPYVREGPSARRGGRNRPPAAGAASIALAGAVDAAGLRRTTYPKPGATALRPPGSGGDGSLGEQTSRSIYDRRVAARPDDHRHDRGLRRPRREPICRLPPSRTRLAGAGMSP